MNKNKKILLAIIGTVVLVGVSVSLFFLFQHHSNKNSQPTYSNKVLVKKRFVKANLIDSDERKHPFAVMDLKKKNFFTYYGIAVKNKKFYLKDKKIDIHNNKLFANNLNMTYLDKIIKIKYSTNYIRKQHYVLELPAKKIVNYKAAKQAENGGEDDEVSKIDYYYALTHFSKVKIKYNLDYLPTKLYLYVNGKWDLLAEYSYPYTTQKEFDKEFKNMVAKINAGDLKDGE